ncbi:MAG TPA: 3-oxoacyl-ACP synthase [Flavobacterium sp.]|jgi:hypothetical protein|nr:3-oxoacyl-ACP synthase [Flavobacterium sp.]
MEPTFIKSYCSISRNKISRNGVSIFNSEDASFADFSKNAYRELQINYPKFFKMDNLSKIAFLASEVVLKGNTNRNIALLFANRSSSLDTDVKYQNSIADEQQYFPSPAVFVYTLANIGMGEISIKNQLHTENCFFIFDAFDAAFMTSYAKILINTGKAAEVLCAWTEILGEDYRVFMYLVGKKGIVEHTEQTIKNLYDN